jgi:hypothetical protein
VTFTLAILSDLHYAGPAERARGDDYELRGIRHPIQRRLFALYRHVVWMRHPLQHAGLVDRFLREVGNPDLVIANGDYSCSSAFIGLADDASFQSAAECLGKLRARFGAKFHGVLGDHEFGKLSFLGARGGMRLAGWERCVNELRLRPFWQLERGRYTLLAVTSSLVALPLLTADLLPAERPEWERLRARHLEEIRAAFTALSPERRVLLFCHDPSALPFLGREEAVRARLPQIEQTVIGHLHSNLYLWKSRLLAGMPPLKFLGPTAKKLTTALSEARRWRPFRVKLCPALAGIELLKDGGYITVDLDGDAARPARWVFHRLRR